MFSKIYSIKNKLIISNVLVLLLVCAIFSVFNYCQMIGRLESQAKSTLEKHVGSVASRAEFAYEEMCDLILNTSAEAEKWQTKGRGQSAYSKMKALKVAENLNLLSSNSSLSDYIAKLMLIRPDEQVIQRGYIYGSADDGKRLMETAWYQNESEKKISNYALRVEESPFFAAKGEKMIPMGLKTHQGAFVYMGISLKLFQDILMEYNNQNSTCIFTSEGDHVASLNISEEARLLLWESFGKNRDGDEGFFYAQMKGEKWLVYYEQNPGSHLIICEMLKESTLTDGRRENLQIALTLFLSAIFIGMVTFRILSAQIDRPIQRLINRINIISGGNFERDPSIEGKDELGKIGVVINQMSERIENLMFEEIQSEKEKKDLEIRMLQAQINPHFLYNTLDSIKWVAAVQENTGIVNVVTALTGLLRNMAKGFNERVTLEKELHFLEDYIIVERFKYVELFDVEIVVDEEILYQAEIVKLTLQPIVENAILNGIEPTRKVGKIWIRAYRQEGWMIITIKDNGIGMSKEKLEVILKEHVEHGKHSLNGIGLKNVDQRLKLAYGENSGVSVTSKLGEGTEVRIKIPFILVKEQGCIE